MIKNELDRNRIIWGKEATNEQIKSENELISSMLNNMVDVEIRKIEKALKNSRENDSITGEISTSTKAFERYLVILNNIRI